MLVYVLIELLLYTIISNCQNLESDEVIINQGAIKGYSINNFEV